MQHVNASYGGYIILKDFLREIENRVLVFDGSKGYMLQKLGLAAGECSESWNITHKDEVKKIYEAYKNAGSDVIQTNTFPGNRVYLEKYSLGEKVYEINKEGTRLAREVMGGDGLVAAAIGPTGVLFEPSGEMTFEYACEVFKEQVKAVADGGADIINFETFTDLSEMRAALLAAKGVCSLPVVFSAAFESNGRTLMGSSPQIVIAVLKSLGADMVGTNCSFGPEQLLGIIKDMYKAGGGHLSVKPNAGLPEIVDGKVLYRKTADKFSKLVSEFVKHGVRLIGGCCGTTPEFVRAIKDEVAKLDTPVIMTKSHSDVITSTTALLELDGMDRINTGLISTDGNERLFNEISSGNMDIVVDMSMDISAEGYDAVCINIDRAGPDETLLANVVNQVQGYIKAPLIIDTKNPEALDAALRLYGGKAGILVAGYPDIAVNNLTAVAGKYGAVVIDRKKLIINN